MTKILILIFISLIPAKNLYGLEVSAGMRESFISKNNHPFGGQSTARLRRNLFDQGFSSLMLNTKLKTIPGRNSHLVRPLWSSSQDSLDAMISLVHLVNGELMIKPQVVKGNLYTVIPYEIKDNNLDDRTLLYTYQKELSIYLTLSRKSDYKALVIGSGINSLYKARNNKRLINLHSYIKKSLGYKTDLIFNINDIKILEEIKNNSPLLNDMKKSFSEITYSINQLDLNLLKQDDTSELILQIENLYRNHVLLFGSVKFSISGVFMPSCLKSIYTTVDMKCETPLKDEVVQKQLERFSKVISSVLERGVKIENIEIISSSTDYEPDNVDPRYIYHKDFFKELDIKKLFKETQMTLRIDPPLEERDESYKKLACIFYDAEDTPEKKDNLGRIHSTMLQSLMGAFPAYSVKRSEVKNYKKGDLDLCEKSFYIASHFSSEIPETFIKDSKKYISERSLMWFNYKFSELKLVDERISFSVPFVLSSDQVPTSEKPDVGFYQFFEYKGEEFYKKIGWSPLTNNFISSTEINSIQILKKEDVSVLSYARHNKTNSKIPYAVTQKTNSGEIWYIADLPFSFVHYEDRYLILTDILWDFLEETPKSTDLKALVRFEDIAPNVNMSDLNWAMTYLKSEDIPFSLALIPYYSDMAGVTSQANSKPTFKPVTKFPYFLSMIKYAKALDADFVWHGVAHQVDDFISGYNGISGSDYEFWLFPENVPIPYDSVDWVMNRLEMGEKVLADMDIVPMAWEIPHYAASALDYYIFGKVFEWTYHRPVNFTHEVISNSALKEEHLMFTCVDKACREERKALLRNIKVEADYSNFGASLYPYPIYKDTYGQKIIPETLGMIDFAFYSKDTWRPVAKPQDILRRAKKLRVIRGAYASFFWHPSLLNKNARYYNEVPGSYDAIGGKRSLINIIEGLKDLGYTFASISDCNLFPQKGCK